MVFMPVGYQHYLNSTDEEQPEYKEIASQLVNLAEKTHQAYMDHRIAIRDTLFV
jgi:hypothetical protein